MTQNNSELTPEQKWEQATIANNFIFYKVMRHNPDVCKELLEILLEMQIDHIEMRGEETVEIDYGSKGIRLDVYAKNETHAFNIEVQSTDTKELPERSRYYQGSIDVDCLKSGERYKDLKDSDNKMTSCHFIVASFCFAKTCAYKSNNMTQHPCCS
ncbi:MAG: Rpn family recombination-promoting nuclease/putative transposase [Treponema sp.]|nr:Rpn family recombination-promoting nuclease/putative transposase [Treponema sp.]